ncbi:hypothetical protein DH2020_018721 [Rehmannia glutinosa]|uniref:Putative plant transposon protein domain-containing protein n=1 Tax=Rehmannia glutinosa TaxID=99300 RepID=A0ABR0WNB8_REHGL
MKSGVVCIMEIWVIDGNLARVIYIFGNLTLVEYAKPPSPVHAIVPGEEGNAINVEDTPDVAIIQEIHGPIGRPAGTPVPRRSKHQRGYSPSVFEEPSPTDGDVKKKRSDTGEGSQTGGDDFEVPSSPIARTTDFDGEDTTQFVVSHRRTQPHHKVVLSDDDEPDRENSPFDDDAPLAQVLVDIIANLGVKVGADSSKQTPAAEPVEPTPPANDPYVSESASEDVEENVGTPKPTPDSEYDLSDVYSEFFYSADAADRYQVFKGRKFIEEKVRDHTSFERYNLNKFFTRRSLVSTIDTAVPYIEKVVHEFYANLTYDVGNKQSSKFGKVFVRNKLYDFSPSVINEFFGTPDCAEGRQIRDFNMVLKVLTGNRMTLWPAHPKKVSSSALTSLYGVLFKIDLSNWVPSSHSSSVTREQARVIYLIGKGLPLNFGQLVFDQVLRQAESSSASGVLPFPSTIYQILCSQGFDKLPNESFTLLPEMISVSPKLMDRNKQEVDLPLYFSDDEPAAQADVPQTVLPDVMPSVPNISVDNATNPSYAGSVPLSLDFVQGQITFADQQIIFAQQTISTAQTTILNAQKQLGYYVAYKAQFQDILSKLSGQKGGEASNVPVENVIPSTQAGADVGVVIRVQAQVVLLKMHILRGRCD